MKHCRRDYEHAQALRRVDPVHGLHMGVEMSALQEALERIQRRSKTDRAMGEDYLMGLAMAANEITDMMAEAAYVWTKHPSIDETDTGMGLLEADRTQG